MLGVCISVPRGEKGDKIQKEIKREFPFPFQRIHIFDHRYGCDFSIHRVWREKNRPSVAIWYLKRKQGTVQFSVLAEFLRELKYRTVAVVLRDQVYTSYIYFISSGKKITRIYSALHIYFVTESFSYKRFPTTKRDTAFLQTWPVYVYILDLKGVYFVSWKLLAVCIWLFTNKF